MVRDKRNGIDMGLPLGSRALKHIMLAATTLAMLAAGAARAEDAAPATAAPSPAVAAPAPVVAAPATPAEGTPAADDAVVAQRGDVKLTASAVRDLIRYADPDQRHLLETNSTALLQAVRDRLLKMVLVQQAEAVGWDKREDVASRVKLARDDALAGTWISAQVSGDPSFPTDDQIQAAYEANKAKLMIPRQYHIAQIFLTVPAGATKQMEDDDQHKLADLRQQLVKQHADFATLAKRYSDEKTTAANGGDLGWVREDALVPPIRAVVQGLAEGAVAEPLRSPNGWHLIKLLGSKPATQATLAEARDTLVKAMRQERLVEGQRNYLANMLKQEPIQVNEIELSKLSAK
jgi:peptidylprolyl isomerase